MDVSQSEISALRKVRLSGISMERLLDFLRKLDRDIEIVVRERPKNRPEAEISISAKS